MSKHLCKRGIAPWDSHILYLYCISSRGPCRARSQRFIWSTVETLTIKHGVTVDASRSSYRRGAPSRPAPLDSNSLNFPLRHRPHQPGVSMVAVPDGSFTCWSLQRQRNTTSSFLQRWDRRALYYNYNDKAFPRTPVSKSVSENHLLLSEPSSFKHGQNQSF